MTTLLVARHGQTDWNLERRWQGHADLPLNDTGRSEAQALGEALAGYGIEAVYSSDLVRARETAEIVGARLGMPVVLDPRLREVDVGEWAGLTTAEVEERFPEGHRRRREGQTGWETGEQFEAMERRVAEALLEIAAAHPAARVLVVTHGGPVRAARNACGGELDGWRSAGNCDYDEIAVEGGRARWQHSIRGGLDQQEQGLR
jgi:broad specificity phosphatase PhoE